MRKGYILIDKCENRIETHSGLSGSLDVLDFYSPFKIKFYTSFLKAWVIGKLYGLRVVELKSSYNFTYGGMKDSFMYLMHRRSGIVYRVWDGNTHNLSMYSGKIEWNNNISIPELGNNMQCFEFVQIEW